MLPQDRWLLPEGIEEILPPAARRLEQLRRILLDLYARWGYELVVPPLIEFLESLLTGAGNDLDLQTFKLTDQRSGRMMGVRADMTPQVARIDAHLLKRDAPVRLCYLGTVLRTRADGFGGSRSPYQIGVELYGHQGIASDLEVLALLLETLVVAGIDGIHLDLAHVAVFRELAQRAGLEPAREAALFDALQRKALPEIRQQLAAWNPPAPYSAQLLALAGLHGGPEILAQARAQLADAGPVVQAALDALQSLTDALNHQWPSVPVHVDLAELRGYHYHTGVVFAAYVPGQGQAVAQGGRYDEIGQVFGRARPATGFSADLVTLLRLGAVADDGQRGGVYAPTISTDAALEQCVAVLRSQGERVIRELPGAPAAPEELGCDRRLVWRGDSWRVVMLGEGAVSTAGPTR